MRDAATANKVIAYLQDQGFRVWYDEGIRRTDDQRIPFLRERISNASAFLILATRSTLSSFQCAWEVSTFMEAAASSMHAPDGAPRLLPVNPCMDLNPFDGDFARAYMSDDRSFPGNLVKYQWVNRALCESDEEFLAHIRGAQFLQPARDYWEEETPTRQREYGPGNILIEHKHVGSRTLTRYVGGCLEPKIPHGIEYIEHDAMLTPSAQRIIVPEGVRWIADKAFSGCGKATEIVLPNTVEEWDPRCFFGCVSLKRIVAPVPSDGGTFYLDDFADYPSLTEVIVGGQAISKTPPSPDRGTWKEPTEFLIPENAVVENLCRNLEGATRISAYKGTMPYVFASYAHVDAETDYEIIGGMQKAGIRIWHDAGIVFGADWDAYMMNHVAHSSCLVALMSPNYAASSYCRKELQRAKQTGCPIEIDSAGYIKAEDRYIGTNAFFSCPNLKRIEVPSSIRAIGLAAFLFTSLEEIALSAELKVLSGLIGIPIRHVDIPDTVEHVFMCDCPNLTAFELPQGISELSRAAFMRCGFEHFAIPENVCAVPRSAFAGCARLQTITIPKAVEAIEDGAFTNCAALTDVEIGPSVTRIGANAFRGCTSLRELTIPPTVQSIGPGAFSLCDNLALTISRSTKVKVHRFAPEPFKGVKSVRYDDGGEFIIHGALE